MHACSRVARWLLPAMMGWLTSFALIAHVTTATAADVIDDLITPGLVLGSGQTVPLPKPQMAAGLSHQQQQNALRAAAGKHPLDRFTRRSVVAPFSFEITSLDDPQGRRRGQRVDFCFVAYGTLDEIIEHDLFGELTGANESGDSETARTAARALAPAELQARGLSAEKTTDREESYVTIDIPILNRVQLRGVGHALRTKQPGSVMVGMVLDDRFRDDRELANTWSPIVRDAAGRQSVGTPASYAGLGGYMKVTALAEPAGALFVECHLVFDEPDAWFGGKNILRSKLPLVVQDNVRTFRRKLTNSGQQDKN